MSALSSDCVTYTLPRLVDASSGLGKPEWRPMLEYVAHLHERSIHAPVAPFKQEWEEIGPGYQASPAFGHWDIVHAVLDIVESEPEHARKQIENLLDLQFENGFIPAVIWMQWDEPDWSNTQTHPPVWPFAVDEYVNATGDYSLLTRALDAANRQIAWFNSVRKADGEGYFYNDILTHEWESGVDEGVRFIGIQRGPKACVDATSHVALLYLKAAEWSERLGLVAASHRERLCDIERFVQSSLFDFATGFFHDIWAVGVPSVRTMAYEGIWPIVTGIATREQAMRVIEENLLSSERFFAPHPITTVARDDPRFEHRMWRGPAWNSMTLWAAKGCANYDRWDAVREILKAALDSSSSQFERTGTIWEFYDPFGGDPQTLLRKPGSSQTTPCRDYLGHNPLIAMARLWSVAGGK